MALAKGLPRNGYDDRVGAVETEMEYLLVQVTGISGMSISTWNDAPERTFADILRVVDEIERMELTGEVR